MLMIDLQSDASNKKGERVAILSTTAPADTSRMGMLLDYASAAAAMDYKVLVFLALDSVLLVKKDVYAKLDLIIREKFESAISMGVKFVACSAAVRGFDIKELVREDVEVWGAGSFFAFAETAKITISL